MERKASHRKITLLVTTALLVVPAGIALGPAPAMADDSFLWFETTKQYYRSEVTGAIVPLRQTDPPYNPADKSMTLLSQPPQRELSEQRQVLDEMNFEAQQIAERQGVVTELRSDRANVWRKTTKEFGSWFTQTGSIAHEQHNTLYDTLIGRAEAEARLQAIGLVVDKIKPRLTRDGLMHYLRMMETEQANIAIFDDMFARLNKTQRDAVAIDVASLGLARIGGYVSQLINKARTATQVTTQQAAVRTAEAAEQRAAGGVANAAVNRAEQRAVTAAAESKAAEQAAGMATNSAQQAGARAAQAETTAVARQAEAKAAEEAFTAAQREVGRTGVTAAQSKAAAEATEQALTAAQSEAQAARQALTGAQAEVAVATEQTIASARTALGQAQARVATADAAVQAARLESQTALSRAAQSAAEATTARSRLATATQREGAARAAVPGAKAEAAEASNALSRAQTGANLAQQAADRAATNAANGLATLADRLGRAQAANGAAVGSAAQNHAQAAARVAAAEARLATTESQAAATGVAREALAAARQEAAAARQALAAARGQLWEVTQKAAKLQQALTAHGYLAELAKFKGTETSGSAVSGFAFDFVTNLIGNLITDKLGDAEWRAKMTEWLLGLDAPKRAQLDQAMRDAPPAVQDLHRSLTGSTAQVDSRTATGIAPVGSDSAAATRTTDASVAPVASPATAAPANPPRSATGGDVAPPSSATAPTKPPRTASNDAGTAPVGTGTIPAAPTELAPDVGEREETGTPAPKPTPTKTRRPRRVSQAPATGQGDETALAMAGGLGFQFASAIPAISFAITPAVAASTKTYVMVNSGAAEMTDGQRTARLEAIQAIRGRLPQAYAGAVQQPYEMYAYDPSEDVQRDLGQRRQLTDAYLADRRERDKAQLAGTAVTKTQPTDIVQAPAEMTPPSPIAVVRQPAEMAAPVETPPASGGLIQLPSPRLVLAPGGTERAPVTMTTMPSAGALMATMPGANVSMANPATTAAGIGGTYRLQDGSSGVRQITVVPGAGGTVTVNGLGPALMLERDGDSYVGGGAVLFGQGQHTVRLTLEGSAPRLVARHPSGASFSTTLLR